MENNTHAYRPLWRKLLSNHNPLYLISAWVALHGIGLAFRGEAGLRWVPLMTELLCGYTLAIALAGWLVVRVGKVWEDARMILLVVLLMFTALSTSYDDLCLRDPAAGAVHLGFGFCFSCAITELILYALGMNLSLRYRLPFYLQLAVLFAFPALLGELSKEGRDPAMGAGVLLFPVVAGGALLTLWPAAAAAPQRENGTPWPWPLYPWSIFVFVAIASAIRAWMLSVSFSPAAGVLPAFMPYLLCPILLVMVLLALELGLRQKSRATQALSLFALLGIVWLAFPGVRLNDAQLILLNLMEENLSGPPLIVCAAAALVGAYGIARRAAGSEFVTVLLVLLLACLRPDTRSGQALAPPNAMILSALAVWQFGYGVVARSTPRLVFASVAIAALAGRHFNASWLFAHDAFWLIHLAIVWCMILLLFGRDAIARAFRSGGPFWLTVIALETIAAPRNFTSAPVWAAAIITTAIVGVALLYWAVLRVRWYVVPACWAAALACFAWISVVLAMFDDLQVRRGLAVYAIGCLLLGVALLASLWKGGLGPRAWNWLQAVAAPPPDTSRPVSSNPH